MIQGVIFDLGSTLLEFKGVRQEAIARSNLALAGSLVQDGLAIEPETFIPAFDRAMEDYFLQRERDYHELTTASVLRSALAGFGMDKFAPEVITHGLERMYAVSEALWRPMPAMNEVLDALQQQDYKLSVISNAGDNANVQRLIEAAGLRRYFSPILVSAALGVRKPAPVLYEIVLDCWQLSGEQVVMVGDTLVADIWGAQQVGLRQIWMSTQADRSDNVDQEGRIHPEATAASLEEVAALLREMSA